MCEAAKELSNSSGSDSRSVLLVDDDMDNREALSDLLVQHGYQVWEAGNGRQALQLLKKQAYHAQHILLDLDMPIMNGGEFIGELSRQPHPLKPKIIVITGQIPGVIAGVSAVLRKPIDFVELIALMQKLENGAKTLRSFGGGSRSSTDI